jgi:hypothetical protein
MKKTVFCFAVLVALDLSRGADSAASIRSGAIPWSEIGAIASVDHTGNGLGVVATESGARRVACFNGWIAWPRPQLCG